MEFSMTTSSSSNSSTLPDTAPPFLGPPLRQRETDEMSIASDFSVIPESLVEDREEGEGGGGGRGGGCRSLSTTSFLHSEDLQPSLRVMETHSKVTFQGVQATYFQDSDIAVSYTLDSEVCVKSSDRVGLYRVGFSSPQDYLGYQWAPTPAAHHTAHHLPRTVVFKAANLPKEAGEFFQFCYVTHEGKIVGVSAPFQLLRVCASRDTLALCLEVEEDGMVVVRSNESVLHDKVNQLTLERERLQGEARQLQDSQQQQQQQLQDKTQQLNMCQHHLQALEVKMKRETSEKCELMGRVGQVVEEKGHLEDQLRTLQRGLTTHTERADAAEERVKELEEAALTSRKSLDNMTLTLATLKDDLTTTKQDLKVASECLEEEKRAREKAVKELGIWTSHAEADMSEKNSLAIKFSTVNEELITKLQELEGSRKNYYSMEERLNHTLKELEEAGVQAAGVASRLEAAEGEQKVFREREEVLRQDNTHLQASNTTFKEHITHLEEEQRSEQQGREAAEVIAGDLSARLQAARAEYQAVALVNRRLAKKLKKMRQRFGVESATATATAMSTSTCSTSSWLHAEAEEEEEEEVEEEEEEETGEEVIPASLTQSCHSSQPSQHTTTTAGGGGGGGGSCCSHSTQELSEAVNRRMEGIVRELSQQIHALKDQLEEKSLPQPQPQPDAVVEEEDVPQPQPDAVVVEEEDVPQQEEEVVTTQPEATQPEAPQPEAPQPDAPQPDAPQPEAPQPEAQQPVLYGNTFLPTAPTAPVFLPEGSNTTATAAPPQPATTDAAPQAPPRTHYYTPPQQVATNTIGFILPPPLLPETTPAARHAAVLSQFTHQQQQVAPTTPTAPSHDSDDDDYHSTSDSDSLSLPHLPPPATALTPPPSATFPPHQPLGTAPPFPELMNCPFCSLSFPSTTNNLLQEHVDSHLEHICPVCSEAFQRNCQDRFREHVESHFREEEEQQQQEAAAAAADPSGPWGRHLRNAHLLEID